MTARAQSEEVWGVWLQEVGSQKREVVKSVKSELGLGLKGANDLVNATPCLIAKDRTKERAEEIAAKLTEVGATAWAVIEINATNFPDENFRVFVKQYDTDNNGYLSTAELAAVTTLECKYKSIADLKGIEHFTALKELNCSNNQLTSLYVNANTAMEDLSCNNNQLTSLNVKNNTALKWLNCSGNQLTSLNVDNNTTLTSLSCYNNQLKSLDVRYNTALTKLLCGNNQLTTLDMWKNTAMEELFCENNQLTTLNVSKNAALTKLWCYNNRLKSLDVSNNTVLKYLYCYGNQLTRLNVFTVPAIKDAVENGTKDTSNSDYDRYTSTQSALYVDKTVIIVTVEPEGVAINATNFPNEKFRSIVAGTQIDKDADGYLSTAEIAAVTELDVHWKRINDLTGVEHFTALTSLDCSFNSLHALDVSKNTELTSLNCSINYLHALDVSNNNKLKVLSCFANRINGESMLALVNSLPTVTGGKLYVLDPEITFTVEDNVITESQVNVAKGKGWTVYHKNGEDWEEYTGSEVTAIRSIEVSPETKSHWYTLDGKRLSGKPTQKGIYVRNGRKVVVK